MTSEPDWSASQTALIAATIKDLRGKRSAQWLSDVTADLGQRVARSTISELETKRRKYISVAELSVLAHALGVAPLELLYPRQADSVEYLPGKFDDSTAAFDWFAGLTRARVRLRRELAALLLARRRLGLRRVVENVSGGEGALPYDAEFARYGDEAALIEEIERLKRELAVAEASDDVDGR
ncbi:MAG: hypothetical protein NTW76_02045 [Corynebacteriales bacterium]|nr:hypothetical protein [Mycobacteriales bacterium]